MKQLVLRPLADSPNIHFVAVDGISATVEGRMGTIAVDIPAEGCLCGRAVPGDLTEMIAVEDPLCELCLGRLRLLGPEGYRFELPDGREALVSDWSRSRDGVNPGHRLAPPPYAPVLPRPTRRERPSALADVALSDPTSARRRSAPARRALGVVEIKPLLDVDGQPVALGSRCLVHYDDVVREHQARSEQRLKVWTDSLSDVVGWPVSDIDRLAALIELADNHPQLREVYLVLESYRPPTLENSAGTLIARFETSDDLGRCGLKNPPRPATAEWAGLAGV